MNRFDTSSRSRYSLRVCRRAACAPSEWARNCAIALDQFGHAAAGGRHGFQHGWPPFGAVEGLQQQVRFNRRHESIGVVAVRLVHHEDVRDLHDAGLERLHLVAGYRARA